MSISKSKSLRQAIEHQARRLGFHLVGVTSPDPPEHIDTYRSWLEASFHGEMGYLATERAIQHRADPCLILPECRSILVLAVRYPSPLFDAPISLLSSVSYSTQISSSHLASRCSSGRISPSDLIHRPSPAQNSTSFKQTTIPSDSSSLFGRVASYAWGADYHDVLADRLSSLIAFIETRVGSSFPNCWYADTGPILERDLAQRAGLGWIGKNTCLIHPRQGSCFFLAEILLGLDLESDPPFLSDYCGSCIRCLQACPTGCILHDRTVDSRRCISYLTIELKGPIPLELRSVIGDWIFGCDLCQQACPWNVRFSSQEIDPAFEQRPGVPQPELLTELSLSPQAFNLKFKGSPVKRARRRGYLRNVAVALGNKRDPSAVPALTHALLGESEPLVRGHVAWALGRIGGRSARQALNDAVLVEKDSYVLKEIHYALDTFGS
jgi:epoxyqueuosine reductase